MRIDQYRTEPTDPQQYAAWMRMIRLAAWRYQDERETQRRHEDMVLAQAANADQLGEWADYYRQVADQIRDHRANGNYTTMHR
jgi:hypothetical protein